MKINVVSSTQRIFVADNIKEVYVPSTSGIIGILPGHTNLITTLEIGLARIKTSDGQEHAIVISGGILQVNDDQVNILADEAVMTQDLIQQEIEKALNEAEQKIAGAIEPSELVQLEKQLRYERFKQNLKNT